jgi:predicted alpha/beta-hydrolase family hydrolase
MKNKKVSMTINKDESVSGVLSRPETGLNKARLGVILAHGAGNDMNNPLLVSLSAGLAQRGFLALRFNFPYKEKGRKAPDPAKKLILTWQKVYRFLKEDAGYGLKKIVVSGKSMGGRIASQMVADGLLPAAGVILWGYPLHPPGKRDKLRDAHLYRLNVPLLFFAGTRDPLCGLDLLKNVLGKVSAPWQLEIIEGGDHSFHVPKSMGLEPQAIYNTILEGALQWLEHHYL